MPKTKLTASTAKRLPPGWHWDTQLLGFCLILRDSGKHSFIAQRQRGGRTIRVTLGSYPTLTVDQARALAQAALADIEMSGTNPNAKKRAARVRGTTLADATAAHLAAMRAKERSPRSIDGVDDLVQRHLASWLDRPVAEIKPSECVALHRRLTESSGRYAANHAMRALRAVYNTAVKESDDSMPANPTRAVTLNKEHRRREPIAWSDLPAWRAKVDALSNPVRRDLQLFLIFTGLRRTDAATVRLSEIDFEAGTVFRPKPKGGRAFTVPLAACVLDLLRGRQAENEVLFGCDWAFPTKDRSGKVTHVVAVRESCYEGKKKVAALPSPHRLRDTFASACLEAGIDHLSTKILMNHVVGGGDVTMGYQKPSTDHLRAQVEKVAAFLRAKMAAQPAAARSA